MPAYVTLPGTSGNYFDTPDTNLLEADDAHFHQSVGNWTAGAGASTLAQDTGGTPTPQFGSGTAKATTDGTGAVIASLTTPSLSAVEHTVSIDIYTNTDSREAFITLDGTDGTVTALTAGTWTRLSATKTVTAGTKTVTVTYRNVNDSDPAASEEVWLDQACLVAGTSTTFLPSARIVGDLDVEAKIAINWATSAVASQFVIGRDQSAGTRAYAFALRPTGKDLRFRVVQGGAGAVNFDADITAAWPSSDGTVAVVRATLDISGTTMTAYLDGVQAGTASGAALSGGIEPGNSALTVGYSTGFGTAAMLTGDVYYITVRDGISGPVVARFDADDWVGI